MEIQLAEGLKMVERGGAIYLEVLAEGKLGLVNLTPDASPGVEVVRAWFDGRTVRPNRGQNDVQNGVHN